MQLQKQKVQDILKTLPVGYYLKRALKVQLSENGSSWYYRMTDELNVSMEQLQKAVEDLENVDNTQLEKIVRSLMYHEVAHALLTPRVQEMTTELNIFEDERIERLTFNYFQGVDFKQLNRLINGKDLHKPENVTQFFFMIVRFGIGPKKLVNHVRKIVHKYAYVNTNSDYLTTNEYYAAVKKFYYICKNEWNKLQHQKQVEEQKKQAQMKKEQEETQQAEIENEQSQIQQIQSQEQEPQQPSWEEQEQEQETQSQNSQSSNEQDEETNCEEEIEDEIEDERDVDADSDEDDELDDEQDEETDYEEEIEDGINYDDLFSKEFKDIATDSLQNATASLSKYQNSVLKGEFMKIINQFRTTSAYQGSAIQGYSGVMNVRQADRPDCKFFLNQNRQGNIKAFAKIKLNLFIDNSGSFHSNERAINELLYALNQVEKELDTFEYEIVTINTQINKLEKTQEFKCKRGTWLNKNIKQHFDRMQTHNCKCYNIVLFDGDAFCCKPWSENDEDYDIDVKDAAKRFSVFNTQNTVLISDLENQAYIEENCQRARKIFTGDYTTELQKNVLLALRDLLR